jgi:chain length determinant protein EpsF
VLEYSAESDDGTRDGPAHQYDLEKPRKYMSFKHFFLILRARWPIASSILVAIVLAVLIVNLILPKQYMASATVLADIKPDPIAGASPAGDALVAYMATQMDILSSPRVAKRVVKTLGLDQDPGFRQQWQKATHGKGDIADWLATVVKRKLALIPSGESNVINISVKWTNPQTAAALANAFAQSYIATTIELKVDPAKQYAGSFSERAAVLRADLEAKQKLLSDFENSTGIVATDERMDVENSRLAELSTQLVAIQGQRQESQSRQRVLTDDNDTVPDVLQNPVIMALKAELSRAQVKLDDIATRLGVNHPEYISTAAEVASLKNRIAREQEHIIGSIAESTRTNLRRESDVTAALKSQKQRILELKHEHDQAQVLQNDVLTAQRNLDAVTLRLAQSSLEGETPHTNLAMLTPAVEPLEPAGPKILLNCMLAALVGAGLGIAVAMLLENLDPRVRSDADLVQVLGVPLLGRVSAVIGWSASDRNARRALPHLKSSAG